MIKPDQLHEGDKVALVSLSSGSLGDEKNKARLERTVQNLTKLFHIEIVFMPNALIGKEKVYEHPELRAGDLMQAFRDESIKAIFTLTGGDDTIRILPYIDFHVIRDNPKIFMGYSDTTINHFMMYKAGVSSFYGPAAGIEFSLQDVIFENVDTVKNTLFHAEENSELKHYGFVANDPQDWSKGLEISSSNGYEFVQGTNIVRGELLGGCIDTFPMMMGTSIWPDLQEWKNKILFIETSEEQPAPSSIKRIFYNLGAQGILSHIKGILIGRPKDGMYEDEYNHTIKEAARIFGRSDLPIVANCHFGHAWLWNILPIGCSLTIDCIHKKISLNESPVKESENKINQPLSIAHYVDR